ncbi:MAG TPA: F0F1 ATP synthase subunit B [Candidatus Saccharimonadia bacterium]
MVFHFLMAEETTSSGGFGALFTALGLNWQALILNALAFLVVAWVLGRFVYPSLVKALDAKKDELEAASRQEREAAAKLDEARNQAQQVLAEARQSADEVLAAAKADASAQLDAARAKAGEQAERIVTEAREQLARDVLAARKELKTETAKLVASATEAVLGEKLDEHHDSQLIGRTLEGK